MSDADLVALYQKGEVAAFARLYERHVEDVERVCRSRLWDDDAVQDAVQETFVRTLRVLSRFDGGERVGHYLKKVARSVCIDHVRRTLRTAEVQLADQTADSLADSTALERDHEDRSAVRTILSALSASDAALLREHHLDDLPLSVMAARRGATTASMKVRLHRARRRAFDVAKAEGLRGVLPVLWLRRWARRASPKTQWFPPDPVVATLVMPMIVVIGLLAPSLDNGSGGTTQDAIVVLRPAVSAAPDPSGRGPTAKAPHARAKERGLARDDARAERPRQRSQATSPNIRIAPVKVDGTPYRIHQERPRKPDRTYGARVDAASSSVDVYVENSGDKTAPVDELVCTAAESAPAVTYCDRGN